MPPQNRFSGKVALVSGGSSGIGRAAALAFAREGAKVVIAARGAERGQAVVREIEAFGGAALFVRADVSESGEVQRLFEEAIQRFGRLDCAFNNAASVRNEDFLRTADLSEEQFEFSVTTNLKSVWLCMQQEIRQMLSQEPRGGAIVNTSSVNGLGGTPLGSLYSAAKAGILGLTKSAALEYSRENIRVNALVAGGFRTPMLDQVIDLFSKGDAAAREKIEQRYTEFTAVGRIGNPEEAAEAALWLCSDAASYVTGNSLIVDGGQTAAFR